MCLLRFVVMCCRVSNVCVVMCYVFLLCSCVVSL